MGDTTRIERVFFVPRAEVALGRHPRAEPVVLIDASIAHRTEGLRELEIIDAPTSPEDAPPDALPVFTIGQQEAVLYASVRAAVITRDLRATAGAPGVPLKPEDRPESVPPATPSEQNPPPTPTDDSRVP